MWGQFELFEERVEIFLADEWFFPGVIVLIFDAYCAGTALLCWAGVEEAENFGSSCVLAH